MAPLGEPFNKKGFALLASLAMLLLAGGALVRWRFHDDLQPQNALRLLFLARDQGWALPAFAAAYVTLTTLFAPAVVFHLIAGAAWGFPVGLAINLAAFNLTAHLHFWAARRLGRERVVALLAWLGLKRLAERLSEVGLRSAIAVRVLPFPTLVASASAGVSGMRWRDFGLGIFLGALPWVSIYTYFAAAVVAGAQGAERRSFLQAAGAAAAILAASWLTRGKTSSRQLSP